MCNKQQITVLVNSVKTGDQVAFKAIHDLYYNKLYAFINSYTKNGADTEDILQETFIKLWNSREKLDSIKYFNSYLYKTAYYTYADKCRKSIREQNILDGWKYKRLIEAIDEDDEINKRRVEKLKLAIEKLPTKCKEVFVLCKIENLTHAQIAEHLQISPKTVQAHMSKAYKKVREIFEDSKSLLLFIQLIESSNLKIE